MPAAAVMVADWQTLGRRIGAAAAGRSHGGLNGAERSHPRWIGELTRVPASFTARRRRHGAR
ncbi:hypothetical protein FHR61_003586 [Xanthomonas arboricola]|nr:hypothetical protein [Xanthomonas cannabis]